jgi:hypothetical protein
VGVGLEVGLGAGVGLAAVCPLAIRASSRSKRHESYATIDAWVVLPVGTVQVGTVTGAGALLALTTTIRTRTRLGTRTSGRNAEVR